MPGILFLSSTRYRRPLSKPVEAKFSALRLVGKIIVIGFDEGLRPRRFSQQAQFYLLPRSRFGFLRRLTMVAGAMPLALWIIVGGRARIIVAQSPYEGVAGAIAKRLARWMGRRTVLVIESHGDFERIGPGRTLAQAPSSIRRAAVRWSLGHADALRAVSEATAEQIRHYAGDRPIVHFPAWMDLDGFFAAGDRETERLPDVLYAGVLAPHKGIHLALEAFSSIASECPGLRLVLAGEAEDQRYAEALRRRASEPDLRERVVFAGRLAQDVLARRMASATALILPSLSEGLGRVVIESMAAGTPAIGTRVGGIPEVIRDGVTGWLVPAGDAPALAACLRWVCHHPEEVAAAGRAARAWVRSRFGPGWYVQGYRRVFAYAERALAKADGR